MTERRRKRREREKERERKSLMIGKESWVRLMIIVKVTVRIKGYGKCYG